MYIYISICICRGIGIGLGIGRGECIGPTKRPLVRDSCFRTVKKTQATQKKKDTGDPPSGEGGEMSEKVSMGFCPAM